MKEKKENVLWYYDEEFYNEPSEFEIQIDELKQSLIKSVKDEYKEKMQELLKENQELQEIKKNWEIIKKEHEAKLIELENEKRNLELKMKRARLDTLLEGVYKFVYYRPTRKYEKLPKCNKCDDYRKVEFISPLGRKMKEECECNKSIISYVCEPFYVCEFRETSQRELIIWFKPYERDNNGYTYYGSINADEIITKHLDDFSSLDKEKTVFFASEEECQRYCDYLNSND